MALRPQGGGTRGALEDLLGRLGHDEDDAEAALTLDEVFADIGEDEAFRLGAPSTQLRQDRHLQRFILAMRAFNRSVPGYEEFSDEDVIRREIRESTKERLILNLRAYLRTELHFTRPRSSQDKRPRLQTLVACRNSMIFWIFRERKENVPFKWQIVEAANQTLQKVGRQLGLNTVLKKKIYFGRLELIQLINWDTLRSPCLEVAESHHLAWALSCVCGVRPGSIGYSANRQEQYLTFKDVEITRGANPGMFNCTVNFRYLKGNRDSLAVERGLKFSINGSTTAENLIVSVPHRLLVMLLRRRGLQDHANMESLLNGNERKIRIRHQMLNQPICRGAGPRGLTITDNPASADSLTQYIQRRALDAGYPRGVTMYCWRRKAATEWVRSEGVEQAKVLMGHEEYSRTLRRYYDQGVFDIPVFEIAMRLDAGQARITMDEDSSEVLYRMVDARKIKGSFLEKRVQELCDDSEDYNQAKTQDDIRRMAAIHRRARRLAEQVLHDERKELHDQNLTIEEFEQRKQHLKEPTELAKYIKDEVHRRLQQVSASSTAEINREGSNPMFFDDEYEGQSDENQDFDVGVENRDLYEDDLRDAEDDYVRADMGVDRSGIPVESDRRMELSDDIGSEEESDEAFVIAVEVFVRALNQQTFTTGGDLHCDLCLNNPYFTDEEKDKVWPSRAKLLNHQLGRIHSRVGELRRKLEHDAYNDSDGRFHCRYYGCKFTAIDVRRLLYHIRQSGPPASEETESDEELEQNRQQMLLHDEDKRADGWYDSDFEYDSPTKNVGKTRESRRRGYGLKYSDMDELREPTKVKYSPQYHDVSYDVVMGDADGAIMKEIPAHYQGIIAFGNDMSAAAVPVYNAIPGVTALGNDETLHHHSHPFDTKVAGLETFLIRGDEPLGKSYKHPGTYPETTIDQ